MLAHKYNPEKHVLETSVKKHISIKGWWIFYKLDGVRARFHEGKLYSRSKRPLAAPQSFLDMISDLGVKEWDGELMHSSRDFNTTVSVARNFKDASNEAWKEMHYNIFDIAYNDNTPFKDRYAEIDSLISHDHPRVKLVTTINDSLPVITSVKDIASAMQLAKNNLEEGIMLRNYMSPYEFGRSHNLLKVKEFQDLEVEVLTIENGEGRLSKVMGTLVCQLPNGKQVRVGTGFTDEERADPPKIGDIITITFFEETPDGIPRFPHFKAIRNEMI